MPGKGNNVERGGVKVIITWNQKFSVGTFIKNLTYTHGMALGNMHCAGVKITQHLTFSAQYKNL